MPPRNIAFARSAKQIWRLPFACSPSAFRRSGMPVQYPRSIRDFDIVALFAAELRELGPANFLYADGDALFAHGHRRIQADGTIAPPGLWLLCRECTVDRDGLPHSGAALGGIEAGVTIEGSGEGQAITLLASVPLTSEGWRPLAEVEVIVIKDGRVVDRAADGSVLQQGDVVAAICMSWLAAGGLLRGAAFGALRRFSATALWRRVLTALPPALERRLTASPLGSGRGIVGVKLAHPGGPRVSSGTGHRAVGQCRRMGWTGRAPAPNGSQSWRGLRSTRSTSPCPGRQIL